jgi:hypothetical protein
MLLSKVSRATQVKQADAMWIVLIVCGLIFEFTSDDLLSYSTERAVVRNPILTRLVILAVAGHLACVTPNAIDVFNSKNVIHTRVAKVYRRIRNGR